MNPQDHTKFIVGCVTLLGMSAAAGGCWLLWKGFAGGGELVITLNTAISGLVGFLGGRQMRAASIGPGDTNVSGDATINQQPQQPQPPVEPK